MRPRRKISDDLASARRSEETWHNGARSDRRLSDTAHDSSQLSGWPNSSPTRNITKGWALALQRSAGNRAVVGFLREAAPSRALDKETPTAQRVVEVRPPGRGEASAFDRRDELIARLNAQSTAIRYRLDGRVLRYGIVDNRSLTNFDQQMIGFIDGGTLLPLRLITGQGLVNDPGTPFQPLLMDSFVLGYLDLDDMLASDNRGFQMRMIHILAERGRARDYARRIGGPFSLAEFNTAHRAGHEAQAHYLQAVLGDRTIRFISNETLTNGTVLIIFRSDEGYRIFERFRRGRARVRGGEVFVRTRGNRDVSIDDFLVERAAAPRAAPVPTRAPAAPTP